MSIGSNLSLAGLSGYDFSGIVDAMVNNYSRPLVKMQQQQSNLQLKKDAWRDVNTRLSSLENTLTKLRDSSVWAGTKATSSNSEVLTVSSTAGTSQGTYNIKVLQMAVAQTAVSETIAVPDLTEASTVSKGSFSITVGDKEATIEVKAGASLDDIVKAINNSKVGVTASAVKVEGGYKLALLSAKTGVQNAAVFAEVGEGTVLHDLGILREDGSLNISQAAQDALIEINGITEITSPSNEITSAVPGLTLTLNSETDTKVTVKVTADYSAAEAAVKSFVDQYNSVMSFIENKLSYNKDLGTKGDLYADPVLQGIQNRLRSIVGSGLNSPSGSFNLLADVGISTSGDNFGKSATLTFDTAKFREALAEDPAGVANLFGASAGGVDPNRGTTGGSPEGLANILYEYLHPLVMYGGTLAKTSDNYDQQITDIKDRIADFSRRVETYAENVRLRFVALESQLAAISSQGQWLQMQIDSLNAFYNSNKK